MPSPSTRLSDSTIVLGGIGAFLAVFVGIVALLGVPFMDRDRPQMTSVKAPIATR